MGGSLHRIEVLLFGLLLLLAGLAAAFVSFTQPDAPRPVSVPAAPEHERLHPHALAPLIQLPALLQQAVSELPPVPSELLALVVCGGVLAFALRHMRRRFSTPLQQTAALPRSTIRRVNQAVPQWYRAWISALHRIRSGLPKFPAYRWALHRSWSQCTGACGEPEEHASGSVARSSDDCVAVVAGALAEIWREQALASRIAWIDGRVLNGMEEVVVGVDANPADEPALLSIPQRLAVYYPNWRCTWRWRAHTGLPALRIELCGAGDLPHPAPILAPLLVHGRRISWTRYYPFDLPTVAPGDLHRHLGIYGGAALDAARECLTSLLFAQPPEAFALACLDPQQRLGLPEGVPHLVEPPGDTAATIAELNRIVRRGAARNGVRPLILVIVDPDVAACHAVLLLLNHLRRYASIPLHLMIVQERPIPAGRELYALLPALATSGALAALPLRKRPLPGAARLAVLGDEIAGRPRLLELHAARPLLADLPRHQGKLPPVLWDYIAQPPLSVSAPALNWLDLPPATDPLATHLATALNFVWAPLVGAPAILEPTSASLVDASASVDGASTRDAPAMISGQSQRTLHAPPMTHSSPPLPGIWPAGPGLAPAQVAGLVQWLAADPSIISAVPPGVTKKRLARLLPPHQRGEAEKIMDWLDAAGVLHEPLREALRWREPRLLRNNDMEWIAERLRETRLP